MNEISTPEVARPDGPPSASAEPYDIYIVGTGIIPAFHLTREADAALRGSKEIPHVDKSFGIEEVLGRYGVELTNLHAAAYREGGDRLDAYREIAAQVVQAALDHPNSASNSARRRAFRTARDMTYSFRNPWPRKHARG